MLDLCYRCAHQKQRYMSGTSKSRFSKLFSFNRNVFSKPRSHPNRWAQRSGRRAPSSSLTKTFRQHRKTEPPLHEYGAMPVSHMRICSLDKGAPSENLFLKYRYEAHCLPLTGNDNSAISVSESWTTRPQAAGQDLSHNVLLLCGRGISLRVKPALLRGQSNIYKDRKHRPFRSPLFALVACFRPKSWNDPRVPTQWTESIYRLCRGLVKQT